MTSYLQRFDSAIPMPVKAIGLGLLCGILTWAVLVRYESQHLHELLIEKTQERLTDEAGRNRMVFHRFLKQHVQVARLMATYQPLVMWLDQRPHHLPADKLVVGETEYPEWLPSVATWRGLINPGYFLLSDPKGRLQGIFQLASYDIPLDRVLQHNLVNRDSDGDIHIQMLGDHPHLITSSEIFDARGRKLGHFTLVSRIDDEFVAKLNYATASPNVILALFDGQSGHLIASSQPQSFFRGVRLEQLEKNYVATGKPFFDYGSSELRLQLATLIPFDTMAALNNSFLEAEQERHAIAAFAFTAIFTLLIFFWSKRIERVLKDIHGLSEEVLGGSAEFRISGDALWQLEGDFVRLKDEILQGREVMRHQQLEMQRLRELELLESVADHLGIGVVLLGSSGDLELKTQRVERWEETLGVGWYGPCLQWSQPKSELDLRGKLQQPCTFSVTRLTLFQPDDVILFQDVTEAKRLRRRLQEQQLQFHRITQNARDAIISINESGNVVHWNRAAEAMFQLPALQIVGKPITRIMPVPYRAAHQLGLQRAVASGDSQLVGKTLEFEGLRKDGTVFPIELSLSSFEFKSVRFFTSIVRDITERKRVEQALQESQSRFALFMDHLPAAVFIKVANGPALFVNAYLKRRFGKHDLPAQEDDSHWSNEIVEQLIHDDPMIVAEGWYEIVTQLRDGSGKERTFRIHNFAIPKPEGTEKLIGGIAWDITDGISAAKAMRLSERRFRGIFESAEEGIWLIDADGKTVEINERMAQMLGATEYEMCDQSALRFIDEAAHEEFEALLGRCRGGVAEKQDFHLRTKVGADLWTIVSTTPMVDLQDNQTGTLMLVTDITERKRAEKALAAQEEQLRLILASTGEGIFGLDMNGSCTFANRACVETLGFTDPDDLLGKRMHELIHHTRPDGTHYPVEECPTYRSCTLRNVTFADDEVLWRADGTAFHAEYQSFPMLRDDKVIGAVVSFADITERKRTEDLLKQERDFAEHLIETAPAVVLVLGPGGKIVRFNSFLEDLSGYNLAEVRGESWFDTFVPTGDVRQAEKDFAKAWKGVLEDGYQSPIVSKDGRKRLISWYTRRLGDAAGEAATLLAIGLDVTEQRAKEAQLIQAQKMETVGQLTDGLAHDFNNLLTVILGNLKLMGDWLDFDNAPEDRELLEDAISAAQDAAELTQRLLEFSRQEPLRRERIELAAFLQQFERFLRRTLGAEFVVRLDIGAQVGCLFCDPPQLQSALLNLALNARDAMPKGGQIDLRVTVKEGSDLDPSLAPGAYVELVVIDTGEGMSTEQLARAIEPFYTTKPSKQGSGLGLSMVFRFCEQAGGRFWLASEPGVGTRATIVLPLNGFNGHEQAPEAVFAPPTPATMQGETVLLVEDEERVRKLAGRYLTDLGYQVLMVEDGHKAIEALESESVIDLVFSDVSMPGGINGDDLYRWVKKQRPEVKVLLTTGFSSGRIKALAEDDGLHMPTPLLKPYTKDQLAKAIRDVSAREHQIESDETEDT